MKCLRRLLFSSSVGLSMITVVGAAELATTASAEASTPTASATATGGLSAEERAAQELAAAEAALAEAEAALAREQARVAQGGTAGAEAATPRSVIRPAAVVRDRYRAQLAAAASTSAPFQLFQIIVDDRHSSLSISLQGDDGDADLLLARGQPISRAADALMMSTGEGSVETMRLGRDTVPALATDTYFLYLFRNQPATRPLELDIVLNLPRDEGLDAVPTLPAGLRLAEGRETVNGTEAVISANTLVRLATASGAPPAERRFAIQIPPATRGLDIDLAGDQSDVDLFLVGPIPRGASEPLRFDSENPEAVEAISVRSRSGDPLPAGRWDLVVRRLDQLPTEPLMLKVQIFPEAGGSATNAAGPAPAATPSTGPAPDAAAESNSASVPAAAPATRPPTTPAPALADPS